MEEGGGAGRGLTEERALMAWKPRGHRAGARCPRKVLGLGGAARRGAYRTAGAAPSASCAGTCGAPDFTPSPGCDLPPAVPSWAPRPPRSGWRSAVGHTGPRRVPPNGAQQQPQQTITRTGKPQPAERARGWGPPSRNPPPRRAHRHPDTGRPLQACRPRDVAFKRPEIQGGWERSNLSLSL